MLSDSKEENKYRLVIVFTCIACYSILMRTDITCADNTTIQ